MSCCKKDNAMCGVIENTENQDYLVCTCMGVMKSEVIDKINTGSVTFQELSDQLGVGTGCSSCVQEVQQLLIEHGSNDRASSGCCKKVK